ncbi:MAG: DEAD/DEAH box helicase [Chloroflexi bacterium]|nr:DEAD/DEAH box helicase [Chloroflexota bacterium]
MSDFELSPDKLDKLCNEILTMIEINEARLLNWGFVNTRTNLEVELPELLKHLPENSSKLLESAQSAGLRIDDILKNLLDRKLIFKSKIYYRSRFAETVRLLSLLRQRFSYEDWQTASRLVSDLKINIQRRQYPKRDVDINEVQRELHNLNLSGGHLEAAMLLLKEPDGTTLKISRFQQESIIQIFRNLREKNDRALAIGAGTGAGKTKAFYIPALTEVAATLTPQRWVRILAIYPRIELLKDQLSEAFSEVRKLDSFLKRRQQRPITISAYYGDTPYSAKSFLNFPMESWSLTDSKDGWLCPFFSCPNPDCDNQNLIWYRQDIEKEIKNNEMGNYGQFARLRCPVCNFEVNDQQLLITREQMLRQPPDILFTTTEMLNRRLSRAREHTLFGVDTGTTPPPRLVLLDEIHTYEGTNGAQIAYLLRRWRYARSSGQANQSSVCFVGLSATLTDAEGFLSKLTGVPLHYVNYIRPREEDLIEEGIEYNLALKGDPVSGTSLLSTSVQAVMLLGRMLDPAKSNTSRGAYGQKIFAFTDKLDVINRWYSIEQDAELEKNLSQFRKLSPRLPKDEHLRRSQAGQNWIACESIGHLLRAPLRLGITSSQYRGVRSDADLVIATSTLEVGYNDPYVGAVVQHKAPRSLASFLQRKGRAGRTRAMRPWMVVVTSAYGRDRWAFQHAENLFKPILPPIELPLNNYYVRKIQAAYTLMDWLCLVLKHEKHYKQADVWEALSSNDQGKKEWLQDQRKLIREVLENVLNGIRLNELKKYLQRALLVQDEDTLNSLLWGEPRSLLLEVIPTLLRQLESNWQQVEKGIVQSWHDNLSSNPMPDFVPPNLFSDLNCPEIVLHIPEEQGGEKMRKDEYLPMLTAMTEFAPGHVSKRYARNNFKNEAHWLELPNLSQNSTGALALGTLKVKKSEIPTFLTIDGVEYQVYQPRAYTLTIIPKTVKNTSSARILWRSHFKPKDQILTNAPNNIEEDKPVHSLALTPNSNWNNFFKGIRAYTQANNEWVEITRLAVGVQGETRYDGGQQIKYKQNFEEGGHPAALGFTLCVDALRFDFQPLNIEDIITNRLWPRLYQHLGPEYFLYKMQQDKRLEQIGLSVFEINWLWQLEFSMLVAIAVAKQCSLCEASQEVRSNYAQLAERTLKVIFQTQKQAEQESDEDISGRLHQKLLEYLAKTEVQEALQDNETVLWDQKDSGLADWLQQCYASSLGTTLFTALSQLVPDVDPDDLVLDVEGSTIWVTEATAGGVGLISKIADAISLRPREFDLQMLDILQNCNREQLAIQLQAVAELANQATPELAEAFTEIRKELDLPNQAVTKQRLARILEDYGIPPTRELLVALNTKFLRPNSDADSDKLIALLAQRWQQEEERIGCAIDLRVMAVVAPKITEIKQHLDTVLQRINATDFAENESQVFNLLQSLLWLACQDSCPECIEKVQPYQGIVRPSRALLLALLDPQSQPIIYGQLDWEELVRQELSSNYQVQISCEQNQLEKCKESLLTLLTIPVEIGFQFFFPVIERITRTRRQWLIDLSIREMLYA